MNILRIFAAALLLVTGIGATRSVQPKAAPALARPLREFPSAVGPSRGVDRPFASDVVQAVGADDYINRVYVGDGQPVELYIAYYKDQRSGDKIHSPKNCLPGSGWQPVHSTNVQIGSAEGVPIVANSYLVAQGNQRDMVLYWYQSHGRVIASEYWAKFWLVADALHRESTDGAIIRIWTTAADGEAVAEARAANFARSVYPEIATFLPN